MKPKTLSASSIDTYEKCPARFLAQYMAEHRPHDVADEAANNGTAVHGALELYVCEMLRLGHPPSQDQLLSYYEIEYWKLFSNDEWLADGKEMLVRWYNRQDWSNRTVVSTEVKEQLAWNTPEGVIPISYIWDRGDKVFDYPDEPDAFDVEVVDYKTVRAPVSPAQMRSRIQVKLYAYTAKLKFPDARRIKVTYDLLRHQPATAIFTTDDLRAVHAYLIDVTKRILADDGSAETLNRDCLYCIRRHVCDELKHHVAAGGVLGVLTDVNEVADVRRDVDERIRALEKLRGEYDVWLLEQLEGLDTIDYETERTALAVKARGTDRVDSERVDAALRGYGIEVAPRDPVPWTAKALKDFIKEHPSMPDAVKSQLRRLIRKEYSAPRIETVKKT